MLITLGTGVGGGIVVSGALAGGSHGLAAEIGHLPIDPAGPDCCCGGRGCLELYASGPGLAAQARARAGQPKAPPSCRWPAAGLSRSPPGRSSRPRAAGTPGRPGCSPAPGAPSRARWPA